MIREAAARSVSKIASTKHYKVADPVTLQVEYTARNSLPIDADMQTGAEVLDDRTIRFNVGARRPYNNVLSLPSRWLPGAALFVNIGSHTNPVRSSVRSA